MAEAQRRRSCGDLDCNKAVEALVRDAERSLDLGRVYLFGSRARGDARPDSDIDLAFEHRSSAAAWAEFVNEANENALVLVELDLIDLSDAPSELRERILAEGRLLRG